MKEMFNFNHRVYLKKYNQENGQYGETNTELEPICEVWANIEPISLKQNYSRMKDGSEITHNITIRYFEEAKECKKIIFGNREFNVVGYINPYENCHILVFNCKELLN